MAKKAEPLTMTELPAEGAALGVEVLTPDAPANTAWP